MNVIDFYLIEIKCIIFYFICIDIVSFSEFFVVWICIIIGGIVICFIFFIIIMGGGWCIFIDIC